jgi:hypothetical protein
MSGLKKVYLSILAISNIVSESRQDVPSHKHIATNRPTLYMWHTVADILIVCASRQLFSLLSCHPSQGN